MGNQELYVTPEPIEFVEVLVGGKWAAFEQIAGPLTVIPPHAVLYVEQVAPESGG